jgi:hypothetical protein
VHALMHDQEQLRFKDLVGARGSQNGGAPRRGQQINQILQNPELSQCYHAYA